MGFLTLLAPLLLKVIENLFPDPAQAAAAKLQIQQAIEQEEAMKLDAQAKQTAAQASVIAAEARGESWMQRNWRPTLMFLFMVIIANNYIVFPILHAMFPSVIMLAAPEQMWTLINICVGGYVGGQTLEKVATSYFNNKKFFDVLKQKMGKMTEAQVADVNAALKAAEEPQDGQQ